MLDLELAPLDRLVAAMQGHARFACESVRRASGEFGSGWDAEFASVIDRLYARDDVLSAAVKGYGAFVMDSMRRQKRFERERRYPAKTYAEAAAEVYFNDDYMRRQYLPGLLLSHYLWPHHYQQIEYYKRFFLSALQCRGVTRFAEVGVGTGLYSRLALQAIPALSGVGFDISPVSLEFTSHHLERFDLAQRYATRLHDILEHTGDERYPAVVCVEVLEHLEDPVALLRGLRRLAAPGGKLFVTAALNAAHADHIHLYSRPEEVLAQVDAAGLHLEHCFHAHAYAPAEPGLPVPSALAMVMVPKADKCLR